MPEPQGPSASAESASGETVPSQGALLPEAISSRRVFNALPIMAMVLDAERRIVFSNQALVDFTGAAEVEGLRGLRPGQALGCIHAAEPPGGCGTTESCCVCGTLSGVITAQMGHAGAEPCRMRRRTPYGEEALDLYAWCTPIELEGQRFTIVCAVDVADRLRRHALERAFFQGALRLAEGMRQLARDFEGARAPGQQQATAQAIASLSEELAEVIETHSDLAAAERGDLKIRPATIHSRALLEDLLKEHGDCPAAPQAVLRIDPGAEEATFTSDPVYVRRILAHMVENALEACGPGDAVTLDCRRSDDCVQFSVHRPGGMPKEVQLQIFQRSFTTKGPGRGLGTYMMKLLSDRYLGGRVSFASTPEQGTVFRVQYPLKSPWE